MVLPVIFGFSGTKLTPEELAFFAEVEPAGFIIFHRNIDTPLQLKTLCQTLCSLCGLEEKLILIDQEGGKVQRLQKPHWPYMPSAETYGTLWHLNPELAEKTCMLHAMATAHILKEIGVTVNCAPVVDRPVKGSHDIIGTRAFSTESDIITRLAALSAQSYLQSGILPIAKHIPGHGRAMADSHEDLPVVDTEKSILQETDFSCFQKLRQLPAMMTAHIVYTAYDTENPASLSKIIIQDIIRDNIGFEGVLFSDDLCMKALKGLVSENAQNALNAGCDLILHCNGDFQEMKKVAETTEGSFSTESKKRVSDAFQAVSSSQETSHALAQLSQLLKKFYANE